MKKIIPLLLLYALAIPVTAQIAGVSTPTCEIDEIANMNYAQAEKITEATIKQMQNKPETEGAACLPALQNIGKTIGASIPSFSLGDLVGTFSKAACKAANNALSSMMSEFNASIEAPYGIGSINAGVNNDGKWGSWREPELVKSDANGLKFLDDYAEELGRSAGQSATSPLKNVKDSTNTFRGQINENTRSRNRTIEGTIDDAIKQ